MSGDTQPKKRKDKKRKKDDEDMVKETTVHAPKQPSTGAAQAAKDPSDVQMHIQSDHGTGGHWCAKVVFFILLAGLGALIGLIIMENQGVSNDDTPLSESRYSEFFNGWVDETRQDDHHHEEILAAINSLDDHDDHDDDGGAAEHAVDDHDQDGDEDDDHDDGAPYAEEDDHDDDEEGTQVQDEEDEDEGPAQKLDDDEVEEIFAQQQAAARQEAFAEAEDDDDDDDQDDDGDDDDDDDDDGANEKSVDIDDDDNDNADDDDDDDDDDDIVGKKNKETDEDDEDDDDDDDNNKIDNDEDDQDSGKDDVVTETSQANNDKLDADNDKNDGENDDDDDDDDEEYELKHETVAKKNGDDDEDEDDDDGDDDVEDQEENYVKSGNAGTSNGHTNDVDDDDDDDDNDSADKIAKEIDNDQDDTPFEEEKLSNALNASPNTNLPPMNPEDVTENDQWEDSVGSMVQKTDDNKSDQNRAPIATPSSEPPVTGDTLKDQMDELVRNFNKLAGSLDVPLVTVEDTIDAPETVNTKPVEESLYRKDENDDGDEDEIDEVKRGSEPSNVVDNDDDDDDDDDGNDDDGKDDFNDFVDNDGGEEEYLAKLRSEQQRHAAAEEERKAAAEPEDETSQKPPSSNSDGRNVKVDSKPATSTTPPSSQRSTYQTEAQMSSPTPTKKSIVDDFFYAGPTEHPLTDNAEMIEGNVIIFDENDDAERYSGDEYAYEMEEMEEELEEVEAEEDVDEERLIKQEQEIGAYVPTTFEEFSSMFRPPPELAELIVEQQQQEQLQQEAYSQAPVPFEQKSSKKVPKESLLERKKPPKGAVNKLIYGLHKDPIVIPTDEERDRAADTTENVSAKGEAKSVLTALLSEIPSPPIDLDHEFDKLVPLESTSTVSRSTAEAGAFQRPTMMVSMGRNEIVTVSPPREKHVEFRLPDKDSDFELEPEPLPLQRAFQASDNGSKENLFIPDASEEEMEADEYADEYGQYEGEEEGEEEMVYEDEEELEDIESVLLNQYGSDEEEEPLTDDNIPPGGEDDEASDIDDSDLMRRLDQKYGKLPATADTASTTTATHPEATSPDGDDDEAAAAGWTKIPSRAEEADRSYQEELRRAQQQLDENKAQEALASFERVIARKSNSIGALVGRARSLDALAEQRRSNTLLTDAIAAYRTVIAHDLAVDDATLKAVAERCIDRMRFQGQHAKAVEVHELLIRRFDDEPHYRNQLAVTYLYMNRLPEAKAVLHETLLRWIEDGFALVHYGFVLKTHDQNMELAVQYLREGVESGHEGTQDGRFYFQLGDALQRLGRGREALDVYRKGVEQKLFLSLYQRSLYNVAGLSARPFWTVEQTTYASDLERVRAQWTLIRDEGLKLLNGAGVFVNETENLRDRGDWKQLELFSRGARVERNCARAPVTCRLVEQHLPAARSCKRGQVKFSVMHPGTHVWPHCGPTNCRIRAHLGLNVPDGTHIRVAEETRSWENGKWLIFDDSFEHEVWHNGTTTRLVLIVDFWHPDLSESQRRSLTPI